MTMTTMAGWAKTFQQDGIATFALNDESPIFAILTGGWDGKTLRPSMISSRQAMSQGPVRTLQDIQKGIKIKSYTGDGVKFPVIHRVNGAVGVIAEGGNLPAVASPKATQATYTVKAVAGRLQFTEHELRLLTPPNGAFDVDGVRAKVTDILSELPWEIGRMTYGDSTGILALINGSATSATQTVDNPGNRYLRGGMKVDVTDGTSTVRNSSDLEVIEGNGDDGGVTTSVIFDASVAATDNDIIVRADSAASPGGNAGDEINGLGNIGDATATVGNINPATDGNGFWKSAFYVTTGVVLSETVLDARLETYRLRNGFLPKLIITTTALENKAARIDTVSRRYAGSELAVNLGYRSVDYNGIPIIGDTMCPGGNMFFIDPEYFFYFSDTSAGFEWFQGAGPGNLHWTGTSALYNAGLQWLVQFGTNQRGALGRQTGLTT